MNEREILRQELRACNLSQSAPCTPDIDAVTAEIRAFLPKGEAEPPRSDERKAGAMTQTRRFTKYFMKNTAASPETARVSLRELTGGEPEQCIRRAYLVLLLRDCTAYELRAWRELLTQSGDDRILLIGKLRYSPDGCARGVTVPGLRGRYLLHRAWMELMRVSVLRRGLHRLKVILAPRRNGPVTAGSAETQSAPSGGEYRRPEDERYFGELRRASAAIRRGEAEN